VRFIANKRGLPRSFAGHPKAKGLVTEADIWPHRCGRIAAKLLVFDRAVSLRKFWNQAVKRDLGRGCVGAVNSLLEERVNFSSSPKGVSTLHGDPTYFCLIGLAVGHLTTEIIAHEAVHAAFAYEKRVSLNPWGDVGDFDEERVAYPAGRIAAAIHDHLSKHQLYP
jgi:hypothetical protein